MLAFPSTDLKLKLQKAIEEHAAKETNMKESITSLNKEKDKLLYLSIERGRVIQVLGILIPHSSAQVSQMPNSHVNCS